MIRFYEKFYYGTIQDRKGGLPLGFATPYENNSAFQKRKKTVDTWVRQGKGDTAKYFDNIPTSGFSIAGVVSRYRTSNKLYRIDDPRGFQLEITAENLFELIDNTNISKGVFTDNLIWGRKGSINWLWPADSDEYRKYLAGPSSYVHQPGDVIYSHTRYQRGHHVYLGRRYVHIVCYNTHYDRTQPPLRGYLGTPQYHQVRKYDDMGLDPKPFHVYRFFNPDNPNSYGYGRLIFLRSAINKDMYEKSSVPAPDVKDGEWVPFHSMTSHAWRSMAKMYEQKPKSVPKINAESVKEIVESWYG